jgi:hypothetical protein
MFGRRRWNREAALTGLIFLLALIGVGVIIFLLIR